jgi:hypothetical protein
VTDAGGDRETERTDRETSQKRRNTERDRDRSRERETHTHTETQRQRRTQGEAERQRETDRETREKGRDTERDRERPRERERETERYERGGRGEQRGMEGGEETTEDELRAPCAMKDRHRGHTSQSLIPLPSGTLVLRLPHRPLPTGHIEPNTLLLATIADLAVAEVQGKHLGSLRGPFSQKEAIILSFYLKGIKHWRLARDAQGEDGNGSILSGIRPGRLGRISW